MSADLCALRRLLRPVVAWFGRGLATPEEVRGPAAVVLMGNHEVHTARACASWLRSLGDQPPVILTGGAGLGTAPLRRAMSRYLAERGASAVGPLDSLSEARMNQVLLALEGVPASQTRVEERSANSFENFVFTRPILEGLGLPPGGTVAIWQTPAQLRRAQVTAEDVLRGMPLRLVTVTPFEIDLGQAGDEDLLLLAYRLVGLSHPAAPRPGEVQLMDQFYPDQAQHIPPEVRGADGLAREEFTRLLGQPGWWDRLAGVAL
jgi:uncharacterized SAM-binding protein YcdF (DUF218 family)